MLKNYLKIAFRNLIRNKGYSFINVAGLTVGIACCLLIFVFVRSELAVNSVFEDVDRIYRVDSEWQDEDAGLPFATLAAASSKMKEVYPEVVARTRIYAIDIPVTANNRSFPAGAYIVDSSALTLFGLPLLHGNPATALDEPRSVVIREDLARALFNSIDVVGRTLQILTWQHGEQSYTVSGVWEKLPNNSFTQIFDLQTQVLLSQPSEDFIGAGWASWDSPYIIHFIKVAEGTDVDALQAKLDGFIEQYAPEDFHGKLELQLNPLRTLYLTAENNRGWRTIGLLSALGLLILLIAVINFANLTTARSLTRTREVGVRKTVGALHRQLIGQFFGEALLVSILATFFGALLAGLTLDAFMALTGIDLVLSHVWDGWTLLALAGVAVSTGLLAGIYPAIVFSSFDPTRTLKGSLMLSRSGSRIRKALVIGQFSIAIGLLVGIYTIHRQMDFMLEQDLGFQQEDVLILDSLPREFNEQGRARMETVKASLNRIPGVRDVSLSMYIPGARSRIGGGNAFEVRLSSWEQDRSVGLARYKVDDDFAATYDLSLTTGRFFSFERPSDTSAVVINAAALEVLGLEDPISKTLIGPFDKRWNIVGVVENFHTGSLHASLKPIALWPIRGGSIFYKYLSLQLVPESNLTKVVDRVRSKWKEILPSTPFHYTFMSNRIEEAYRPELQTRRIIGVAAGLAIFIACLGLFGLAAFTAERRTKEIGIRKVMGATVTNIVGLLSKDFIKLVAIGFVIAVPVAYYFMNEWLKDFAYRIDIGVGIFLLAGGLALLIALATVSWQSVRAALANPVDSLRSE